MIYDAFLYNGEKEILEIRMAELDPLNIQHVLISSETTFTNKPNANQIPNSEPHLHVGIFPSRRHEDPWMNETDQRNYIKEVLMQLRPKDDDIIILSDVDEIPRASAIAQYRSEMGICALEMDVNWFYLNTRNVHRGWRISKVMPWSYLKDKEPEVVRNQGTPIMLCESGWHFSYQGGKEAVDRKFASFSHQEPGMKNMILGNPLGEMIPMTDLPIYVQQNQERFKHMIYAKN